MIANVPMSQIEIEQQFDVVAGEIRDSVFQQKIKDALNSGWQLASGSLGGIALGSQIQSGEYVVLIASRYVNKETGEPISPRSIKGFGGMGGIGFGG